MSYNNNVKYVVVDSIIIIISFLLKIWSNRSLNRLMYYEKNINWRMIKGFIFDYIDGKVFNVLMRYVFDDLVKYGLNEVFMYCSK